MNHLKTIHPLVIAAAQDLLTHQVQTPKKHTVIYVGGGAACYGWVGESFRTSKDFDVDMSHLHRCFEFSDSLLLPHHAPQWSVDNRYTTSLSLMHEDFDKRAVVLAGNERVTVSLLAPVDLAISKLDRFSERDRQDIAALAAAGLFTRQEFETLTKEAIQHGIGVQSRLLTSLNLALSDYDAFDPQRRPSRPSKPKR